MNPNPRPRLRSAAIVIAVALASIAGAGTTATVAQDALPEACALHERNPNRLHADDPQCATRDAVAAARIEAASWPDYDSTAISDSEQNIAVDAAAREAAGWPDYDSTAISASSSTDVAANSRRMAQIGAAQAETSDVAATRGNPFVL